MGGVGCPARAVTTWDAKLLPHFFAVSTPNPSSASREHLGYPTWVNAAPTWNLASAPPWSCLPGDDPRQTAVSPPTARSPPTPHFAPSLPINRGTARLAAAGPHRQRNDQHRHALLPGPRSPPRPPAPSPHRPPPPLTRHPRRTHLELGDERLQVVPAQALAERGGHAGKAMGAVLQPLHVPAGGAVAGADLREGLLQRGEEGVIGAGPRGGGRISSPLKQLHTCPTHPPCPPHHHPPTHPASPTTTHPPLR